MSGSKKKLMERANRKFDEKKKHLNAFETVKQMSEWWMINNAAVVVAALIFECSKKERREEKKLSFVLKID